MVIGTFEPAHGKRTNELSTTLFVNEYWIP